MADRTIGELPAVPIGDLPLAPDIYDDTLIPVEQQGEAWHITGKQWTGYAQAATAGYADAAKKSADAAAKSAEDAAGSLGQLGTAVEEAQGYAQEAGASAEAAEQALAGAVQAKTDAETAAGNAAASEEAAAGSATKAETEAQAASDSAYDAARSATAAAASERSAKTAQETTQQAMAQALQARDAAQESAGDAADSADKAEQYSGNPPIIKDGNWWTWDADAQEYVDTGEPSRGNLMFAAFWLDPETGDLYMYTDDEYTGPGFRLTETGDLEVLINAGVTA